MSNDVFFDAFILFVDVLQCLVRVYTRQSGLHDIVLTWESLIDSIHTSRSGSMNMD